MKAGRASATTEPDMVRVLIVVALLAGCAGTPPPAPKVVKCPTCEGDGRVEGQSCDMCPGTGKIADGKGGEIRCPLCAGTGKQIGECPICRGTGELVEAAPGILSNR